ncbi:unnamed protein product [Sphagnum troendelagicum]
MFHGQFNINTHWFIGSVLQRHCGYRGPSIKRSPNQDAGESSDIDLDLENADPRESTPEDKIGNHHVHNFVYVLTEEDRHIAYVEDLYEDKKMRKKLRVRWFHKTNELPCKIPPPAPLAREVFFTSFPQVLSVECVDGLATVLSPEHFAKCLSLLPAEAAPQLHVCSRQLDNSDGLKPFSIHEVKGYWHQQILSSVGLGLSPVGECSPPYELGSEDLVDEEEDVERGNVIRRGRRTARVSRRRAGSTVPVQSGDAADLSTGVSSPATCSNSEGAVACGDLLHGCSPADSRPSSTGRGGDKCEEVVSSIERHVFFEVARGSRRRAGSTVPVQSGDAADLPTGVSSPATCSNSEGAVACGDLLHGCSPADPRPSSTGRGGDKGEEGVSSIERHVFFEVGDRVEMLCQDSGLRGCWFKGVVTRRVSRRLKIQYEELQNEDGEGNLEEWVSAWRLAGPDKLGVRIVGRTTVRPFPTPCTSADYYIGQAVDVWWNDGWWEGIVVSKEPEGNVKVYFPGEGDISSFHSADLRVSKDWVNGSWVDVHCNYEALNAASLSSLAKNCEHPAAVEKKPYAVFPSSTSTLSPTTASLQCDAPSTSASEVDKKFLQYGRNGEKPSVKSKGGKELLSSDHSDERRLRPGNEDVEHLLHFVANCIDTEGELKEEASSAAPQETGCELFPRKSSMPQEAPISDVSPNLDSVSILSNTGGSLVSSDLRWNSARKRMRHGGESLAVLRAEHRVNQFQANNLNPAKEVEDMQAGDGSMSDRENEGLTSPCDQEEPRWRTGERSGERDDTLKLKKLRQGHEGTLKPIHAPPVGGTPLFLGTAPIANLVMSR